MPRSTASDSLARKLRTISSSDPVEIRRQILEAMLTAVPAEVALSYRPTKLGDTYIVSKVLLMGQDDSLREWFGLLAGGEIPQTPWKPPKFDREGMNRFIRARSQYREDVIHSYDVWTEVMFPVEVADNLRALIYRENKMVGWLGLMRQGMSERFSAKEEKILNDAMAPIRAALLAAEALESELLGEGVCAVLTSSGEVEHASEAFRKWYRADFADELKRLVTRADQRGEMQVQQLFQGQIMHFLRLDGAGGVRYMLTAEEAEFIHFRPEMVLTARQREIAKLVVVGATSKEIARELDVSYHTVRTHMKNIYRRLDVASKVDLIQLLGDENEG